MKPTPEEKQREREAMDQIFRNCQRPFLEELCIVAGIIIELLIPVVVIALSIFGAVMLCRMVF